MRTTAEAEAKSAKFSALAKQNKNPHHLGMIGYVGHRARWRAEEQARQAAGIPHPYEDVDVRAKEFMYARVPNKLKPGATKYNEPQYEELEKALVQAAKSKDNIEVRRGHDLLTKVLGTPEHRGRVRGVQCKMSWKLVESWQADASAYKSRQKYKDTLYQKGFEEGMAEVIKHSIKEAFTSNEPEMVAMRSQMFREAGLATAPLQQPQGLPMIEGQPRHWTEDVQKDTHVQLLIPFGRSKKMYIAEGMLHPKSIDFSPEEIPEGYVVVTPLWNVPEQEEYELDLPNIQHVRFLGQAVGHEVLWNKEDIEIIPSTPTPTPTPGS
jgi:hypothetical protein